MMAIITTDRSIISNTFNDFFINVGPNLAEKIPNMGVSPVDCMGQPLVNSIILSEVASNKISQVWDPWRMVLQDMMK